VLFGVLLAVQCWALYAPSVAGPTLFPESDKVVHAALFLAVTWAGIRAGFPVRWLVGAVAAEAVVSELVQGFLLPHRDGDVLDVLADLVGVGLGLLAARLPARPR
jgi:VanZ family protein